MAKVKQFLRELKTKNQLYTSDFQQILDENILILDKVNALKDIIEKLPEESKNILLPEIKCITDRIDATSDEYEKKRYPEIVAEIWYKRQALAVGSSISIVKMTIAIVVPTVRWKWHTNAVKEQTSRHRFLL